MPKKHQVFSSKKSTRTKANRSWRRAFKIKLRTEKTKIAVKKGRIRI